MKTTKIKRSAASIEEIKKLRKIVSFSDDNHEVLVAKRKLTLLHKTT